MSARRKTNSSSLRSPDANAKLHVRHFAREHFPFNKFLTRQTIGPQSEEICSLLAMANSVSKSLGHRLKSVIFRFYSLHPKIFNSCRDSSDHVFSLQVAQVREPVEPE
jgi:hypothetical protein